MIDDTNDKSEWLEWVQSDEYKKLSKQLSSLDNKKLHYIYAEVESLINDTKCEDNGDDDCMLHGKNSVADSYRLFRRLEDEYVQKIFDEQQVVADYE